MFKSFIRFSILMLIMFLDGLITIFFEKNVIVSYSYCVKEIVKTPSEQQKILVDYLKKCHKQVFKKDKNDKAKTKKEIDT